MENTSRESKFSSADSAAFQRIKILSQLLDSRFQIPGTSIRIGLDSILGLIPGIGDMSSALLSAYVIFEAYKLGASQKTLWKMSLNVALDFLIGIIPIFGDAADVFFKANLRNMKLLKKDLNI